MTISRDDLGRLLNNCRTQLPGSTDAAIQAMLFNVIDEFLTNSNSWNEWVPFTIGANNQNYLINPAQQGMIKRLGQVIDMNCVGYPATITSWAPPGINIWLVWPQNMNINVTAIVYKTIVLPTTHDDIPIAPNWLLPLYERAIEAGVVGNMMLQIDKPYSDKMEGIRQRRTFLNETASARVAAARGGLYGGQAWRFPNNFRTNSQRGGVSTPFPQPTSWSS
jgi:hypothetical protein